MDNEKIKMAILLLLERAEKGRRSSWHRQDYWLRRFSIRGRCSTAGADEHRSRIQRSTEVQPLRQWRVK
jgi:hypothetical protein